MSRDLNFTGYWEGSVVYSCDCCGKTFSFHFFDEDEAKDYKNHRKKLRNEQGWIATKVEENWHDFCSERCRNQYIRNNTI